MKPVIHVGIDVGSTTVKVVALSPYLKLLFGRYQRHMSDIRSATISLLKELQKDYSGYRITASISGSGGMGLAKMMGLPFCQEILAETKAIRTFNPDTDVIIELGGEDEKITYLRNGVDQRMNGACAGGTGAFIDRMASLLSVDAAGLGKMAEKAKEIYPIASRCGVFAKTDIQALLNEGVSHEDIALSVFQSVVNQTISGLTCGRPIHGKVAFLGGPLTFQPILRERFQKTLDIKDEDMIVPEHGELYVAIGAAVSACHDKPLDLDSWLTKVENSEESDLGNAKTLPPLFATEEDYKEFKERHARFHAPRADISKAKGPVWLGIDAGSTTIKAVLLDREGNILYEYYAGNKGTPLNGARKILTDLYDKLPKEAVICGAGVTGYGEELIKRALEADVGEVETMAHYRGAKHFLPDVSTILDIGGQDMKCCRIKDGAVDDILLNEACSSGCGSFLDTFAQSLGMDVKEFARIALTARHPVDLGSRCTVFMNSRVREAQKNGVSAADISAGLSYSVIKNALYKVIRLRTAADLGNKVVVQGGTFYNDAVLRALELLLGCHVIRPDVAGLMGAYGIALITKDKCPEGHVTSLVTPEKLKSLSLTNEMKRCPGCGNHCMVTITRFSDGRAFVSGNRCERGTAIMLTGKSAPHSTLPNIYRWKYDEIWHRKSLTPGQAKRGTVGIPRTMNMYEDFPYWHAFFTKLGYRVVTSSEQLRDIPTEAMETIPSYSECFPAKLAHAHVYDLAKHHPDFIWYPCIDKGPVEGSTNSYNCPMVASYPENIQANMDEVLSKYKTTFYHPFLPLHAPKQLYGRLKEFFKPMGISGDELKAAMNAGEMAEEAYRKSLRDETERILKEIHDKHLIGIVLAGRPYHVDPTVNHSIPDLINQLGMAVLSEDGVSMVGGEFPNLRVMNQWTWHSRLYKAAEYVTRHPDLELVELNSFGCGLDAVVTDQVQEIMSKRDRLYTCLKIDQSLNLGAVRIRLRSLKAAIQERIQDSDHVPEIHYAKAEFTEEMKNDKDYTILVPEMSPIHFPIIQAAARAAGYNVKVLSPVRADIDEGLASVNNDACYPAIITIGSLMRALKSGEYDLNRTALMMSQTGGMCRASNYIGFIRRALEKAGMEQIPVISMSAGIEKNPGLDINYKMADRALQALIYGDVFMRVLYKTRPYEAVPGSANALHEKWLKIAQKSVQNGKHSEFKKNIRGIVKEFDELPLLDVKKPRVGIVGEILVKFLPLANNFLVELLESEGAEAVCPDLIDFFMYSLYNANFKADYLGKKKSSALINNAAIRFIEHYRKTMHDALTESKRFDPPVPIAKLAEYASPIVSCGNQTGEGWFLTGEMIELIHSGVPNIVCTQPFGCLPNHVVGKGVIKELRHCYPDSNIVAVDYDPGASEVNQLNRIKLMLSTAAKNLKQPEKE